MKTINTQNVSKLVAQFSLSNLSTERANLINLGWENIKIDESFKYDAINQIVDLLGGRQKTKSKIKFVIKNNPLHTWYSDRIVFDTIRNKWIYMAGQDYPSEIKEIRRQLTTKF